MKRRLTEIVLTLTLTFTLAAVCARAQVTTTPGQPPSQAAAEVEGNGFRLKGLDGKLYDTTRMRGDVLVVSFGATWCVPCTWELVAVEELKEEYAGKPVRFLWVSIEEKERTSDNLLRHYAKERKLSVPVLRDPGGAALMRYEKSGARIPVVAFFDAEGTFSRPAHKGMSQDIALYKQMVRGRVDALLAARTAAKAAPASR